ncbi:MAG: DUF4337 family protein [Pseudomonadota bacterium]
MVGLKNVSWDMIYGVTLAIAAAILGVGDLLGGNADNSQIALINEKSSAYQWYQSKSIKETLVESQRDLVKQILDAGLINTEKVDSINKQLDVLSEKAARYSKEKKEILIGSAAVGKENWIQDVKGKLGEVVGAEEYTSLIAAAGATADQFDMSGLLLQLCLVMGAIGLLVSEEKLKQYIYFALLALFGVGSVFFVKGLLLLSSF